MRRYECTFLGRHYQFWRHPLPLRGAAFSSFHRGVAGPYEHKASQTNGARTGTNVASPTSHDSATCSIELATIKSQLGKTVEGRRKQTISCELGSHYERGIQYESG